MLVRGGPSHQERTFGRRVRPLLWDVRFAVRSFWRRPSFPGVLVALALGVGANSATVTLAAALLVTAPDYVRNPQRVVLVPSIGSYVEYRNVSRDARTIDLAAVTRSDLTLGVGQEADAVHVECVTSGYFDVFPVRPVLGRGFERSGETRRAAAPVVLSHGLWMRRFGGDPAAVGRTVVLGNRGHVVVGVAPRRFRGIESAAIDAWILLAVSPELCSFAGTNLLEAADAVWLRTIGRVRDGFPVGAAAAEVASLAPAAAGWRGRSLVPAFGSWRARSLDGRVTLWLVGAGGLILLAASLNITVLLSIQALDRVQEFAVRTQLGATRTRVFSQFLLEHLVATGAGAVAAAGVGIAVGRLLIGLLPIAGADAFAGSPFLPSVGILALLVGVSSGLGPAVWVSSVVERHRLHGAALAVPSGAGLRSVFVTGQFALALVLVVGAGLFIGTIRHLGRTPGFDADRVVVATVDLARAGYRANRIHDVFETFLQRLERVPQVASAGVSLAPLLESGGPTRAFPLRTTRGVAPRRLPLFNAVSQDYFRTVGTRILRGRAFVDNDAGGRPVMVVNAGLAARLWGEADALGRCVVVGGLPCVEVVGVSEDRRHVSVTGVHNEWFVPFSQASLYNNDAAPQTLLVRARGPGRDAVGPVAAALRGTDADLPYINVRSLADLVDDQTRSWRLGAVVFSLTSGFALVLAAVGSFAALALSVRSRTREIGIRMALGASRGDILIAVLRRGMKVVIAGLVLGVAVSAAAYRLMDSLLVGVTAADPVSFGVACLVVCAAGAAAAVIPAVRAARLEPAGACVDV